MLVTSTPVDLFFSRMLAHLCAPIFIFLTGLAAYLYASRFPNGRAAASAFLWKRGLFLIVLEITVVNFAWTFQFPPSTIYLQVIWAIGLSMLALAALIWLPRTVLVATGFILIAGHNLLDGMHFPLGHALHVPWAVLHDRGWITVSETLRLRISYPLLPWVGVIVLGYVAGSWFIPTMQVRSRHNRLFYWGAALLIGFVFLRGLNFYGDKPWASGDTMGSTIMSFLNVTKYPPSLLFVALTLGIGMLTLLAFERQNDSSWVRWLAIFGSAPMFFYVLHLYVLKLLYLGAVGIWGQTHGSYFGFSTVWMLWLCTPLLALVLYPAVRAFAAFKARRRDLAWLKYL